MNLTFSLILVLSTFTWNSYGESFGNITKEEDQRVLSRRKRFVIFPDGSSFQLVFCTQNHGYLQLGNIVWFGDTAALAWELPSDPTLFGLFKEKGKLYEHRRKDDRHIVYMDEDGRVLDRVPYKRRLIVNPAFAKRSADTPTDKTTISVKEMHSQNKGANLSELQDNSIEFHRSSKMSLYVKLEKVLQTLGWNGRHCILKLLCESRKETSKQGSFVKEIIRATFTLPSGREFEDHRKEYDVARGTDGNCGLLYPECEGLRVEGL